MNPFFFIVGCPRSGTTLLQRIMDAHSLIAVTPETHWIIRYFRKLTRKNAEPWVTSKLIPKLVAYPRFLQLGVSREDLEQLLGPGERTPYQRFVTGIFDLYGRARTKPLVGDKTPGYARGIRELHHLWPDARFIHLIRDGRDVCLSAVSWNKPGKLLRRAPTWHQDPVATAALWWEWHVRMARETGRALDPHLNCELRYEALVADPAKACVQLCAFLGVPYDEAMLRFHENRTRFERGLDTKEAWLPVTAGLRDWRLQMSAEDVHRFELIAGDLLDELGYPRAGAQPYRGATARVSQLRQRFTADIRAQNLALPRHW
jgi:hypothetical protein